MVDPNSVQHSLNVCTLSPEVSQKSLADKPKKSTPPMSPLYMIVEQHCRELSICCISMNVSVCLHLHQRAEDPLMSARSVMTLKMPKVFMVLVSKYDVDE